MHDEGCRLLVRDDVGSHDAAVPQGGTAVSGSVRTGEMGYYASHRTPDSLGAAIVAIGSAIHEDNDGMLPRVDFVYVKKQ